MAELDDAVTVRYTAKELFAQINSKMDTLGDKVEREVGKLGEKLDAKADHEALLRLEVRVDAIEMSLSERRGFDKAKAAIIALSIAVAGLAAPFVLHFV